MRGAEGSGYIIFAALLLAFCSAADSGEKSRGPTAERAARRWDEFRIGKDIASDGNCIMDVNRDGRINILDLIFICIRLNTKCE